MLSLLYITWGGVGFSSRLCLGAGIPVLEWTSLHPLLVVVVNVAGVGGCFILCLGPGVSLLAWRVN